jgi:serine phosphatase RsbU (regulator of sigma subunit)
MKIVLVFLLGTFCFQSLFCQEDCQQIRRRFDAFIENSLSKNELGLALDYITNSRLSETDCKCFELGELDFYEGIVSKRGLNLEIAFRKFYKVFIQNKSVTYSYTALLEMILILKEFRQSEIIVEVIKDLDLSKYNDDQQLVIRKEYVEALAAISDERFIYYLDSIESRFEDKRLNEYYKLKYYLLSDYYLRKDDFVFAMKYYYSLAGIYEELGEKDNYVKAFNNYGFCLLKIGEVNRSRLLFESLVNQKIPRNVRNSVLLNKAFAEKLLGQRDAALKSLSEIEDDPSGQEVMKADIAKAYIKLEQGEKEAAMRYIRKAEQSALEVEDLSIIRECNLFYEKFYLKFNDKAQSTSYSKKVKDGLQELTQIKVNELRKSKEIFSSFQESMREVAAFVFAEAQEKLTLEKTFLDNRNKEQQLELLRAQQVISERELEITLNQKQRADQQLVITQFELERQQQENEIAKLLNQKTLQELSLTKLEVEKVSQQSKLLQMQRQSLLTERELLKNQSDIQKSELERNIGFSVAILSGLGVLASLYFILRIRKSRKVIFHQHSLLQEKSKDISDSIKAAAVFQSGIAPHEGDLNRYFEDGFILYLPLEQVSGDLPFIHKTKKGFKWLAAIDCIGHGIPAAMLSFSVYHSLRTLIQEDEDSNPCEVLKKLHLSIKDTYGKDVNRELNVSIDISLLKIDESQKTILFSGANSPLFVARKSGAIEIIKGSSFSIGDISYGKEIQFETIVLQTNEVKRLFLMSDGFKHQLGGDSDKVRIFSQSSLLKLLGDNMRKSMHEMRKLMHEVHINWKGDRPQTDDILILAIEIYN